MQLKAAFSRTPTPPLIHSAERTHTTKLHRIFAPIIKIGILLAATAVTAKWAIPAAAHERGYTGAIGGEWLVIVAVMALTSWLCWGINWRELWKNRSYM